MPTKLQIAAPQKIGYKQIELPPVGPTQIRIKAKISAISHGTEMTAYLGTSPFRERTINADRVFVDRKPGEQPFYPFDFAGYDLVGTVEEAGEQVTNFSVGDLVYAPRPHQTHYVFDENDPEILKLKPDTPPEHAIMTMLCTVALVGIHDAEVKLGDTVAVFGGGVVGQLVCQMAFLSGASRVFLVEPVAERRKMAMDMSPVKAIDPNEEIPAMAIRRALNGQDPDVVLGCSGKVAGLKAAVQAAGLAGRVVAVGFYAGNAADFTFAEEFIHNRVTIKASMGVWNCPSRFPERWNRRRELEAVLELIESGKINTSSFRMLKVPFAEAQRAYETIRTDPSYMKVILTYEEHTAR